MPELVEKLVETAAHIRSIYPHVPQVGVILGSGLGAFTREVEVEKQIDYFDIPYFSVSTVRGHQGKLIFGQLGGKKIMVMAGRFHYYEGYSTEAVTYAVRLMKFLGVHTLLLSNAAGGVNPAFNVGDLMIIRDHIGLAVPNPLIGPNNEELGPRFPDMSEAYDGKLIATARGIAAELGVPIHEGVYFGVTGPTFETRAEYNMIRLLGADAVGMSTVHENIVAVHMSMRVFAMSVITDLGFGDHGSITHEAVLEAAASAEPRMAAIFRRLIAEIDGV